MATKDNKQQVDRRMFILGSAAGGALGGQDQRAPPKADPHPRCRRGGRAGGTGTAGPAESRPTPPFVRPEPEMVVWRQDTRRSFVPGLQRFPMAKDRASAYQRDPAVAQFR